MSSTALRCLILNDLFPLFPKFTTLAHLMLSFIYLTLGQSTPLQTCEWEALRLG